MPNSRFDSPEASLDCMKRVAVKGSGFNNWLAVEPLKVWQGEAELVLDLRADVWAESADKEPSHVATAQATNIPTGIER
ncbi:MAG: hypothetical protein AAFR88_00425 [Pseudomonadota bacterium]